MMEVWKSIKIEGIYPYEVSNLGRIKALPKRVVYEDGRITNYPTTILGGSLDHKGYYAVSLRGENKYLIRKFIHKLVVLAFIPNPENKPWVNHKDGVRTNNKLENLEWCTPKENCQDAIRRGTFTFKQGAKITQEIVDNIRNDYASKKFTQKELAKKYSLGQSHISRLIRKECWFK